MNTVLNFVFSFLRREIFLAYAAKRTGPILGDILKSSTLRDTVIGIARIGIVHISADSANIL